MHLRRIIFLAASVVVSLLLVLAFYARRDYQAHMTMVERTYANQDPLKSCVTPFGTLLGVADNVPAFSNCNSQFHSMYVGYVKLGDPLDVNEPYDPSERGRVMTGDRYGAMDFMMRWYAFNRGVMPHLQEHIQDMWGQNYFYNPAKTNQDWDATYLQNFQAGESLEARRLLAPRRGDAVIYMADRARSLDWGHIAVIVKVQDDVAAAGGAAAFKELKKARIHPRLVYVAEQNFENKDWGGRNYSRVLQFRWRTTSNGQHEGFIVDPNGLQALGRMRIGKMRELREVVSPYQEALEQEMDEEMQGDL